MTACLVTCRVFPLSQKKHIVNAMMEMLALQTLHTEVQIGILMSTIYHLKNWSQSQIHTIIQMDLMQPTNTMFANYCNGQRNCSQNKAIRKENKINTNKQLSYRHCQSCFRMTGSIIVKSTHSRTRSQFTSQFYNLLALWGWTTF